MHEQVVMQATRIYALSEAGDAASERGRHETWQSRNGSTENHVVGMGRASSSNILNWVWTTVVNGTRTGYTRGMVVGCSSGDRGKRTPDSSNGYSIVESRSLLSSLSA
jgi:hypothetical protein